MSLINSREVAKLYDRMSEMEREQHFSKIRYFMAQNSSEMIDSKSEAETDYYTDTSMFRGISVIAGPAAKKELGVVRLDAKYYKDYKAFNTRCNYVEGETHLAGNGGQGGLVNSQENLQGLYAIMRDDIADRYEQELRNRSKRTAKQKVAV